MKIAHIKFCPKNSLKICHLAGGAAGWLKEWLVGWLMAQSAESKCFFSFLALTRPSRGFFRAGAGGAAAPRDMRESNCIAGAGAL
jgi:hypothetical protein